MARYLVRRCPCCDGYLGVVVCNRSPKSAIQPVNGLCAVCSHQMTWKLIHGNRRRVVDISCCISATRSMSPTRFLLSLSELTGGREISLIDLSDEVEPASLYIRPDIIFSCWIASPMKCAEEDNATFFD